MPAPVTVPVPPLVEGARAVVPGAVDVDGVEGADVPEVPPEVAVPVVGRVVWSTRLGAPEPLVVPHAVTVSRGSVNTAVTAARWRRQVWALGALVFMAAS
ncbi:hypothetical protein AS200_07280 [Streptomyces sp. CdTB01]|nr:hypothetical protein AS200_07280 [Streptomyces sp. CdTB01]